MKSFLSDRPNSAVASLKPLVEKFSSASAAAPRAGSPSGARPATELHAHLPAVECVKQGDRVTHLVVTCTCGERIEIDCLYAGPA